MKHYCSVCHTVHDGRCVRPMLLVRKRNSEADRFRNRKTWRRKSAAILDRDMYCCRICLRAGLMNNRELSVHHIISLAVDFDKRLDEDNLITLCRYHHEQAEKGNISARELRSLALTVPQLPRL